MSPERCLIGGDFDLSFEELDFHRTPKKLFFHEDGTWTLSGRAALVLVLEYLKAQGVRHVHLPAYLCQSLLLAVQAAGFHYSFYPVGGNLCAYPDPPPGSAVLVIHYFGWLNAATTALRQESRRSLSLIEDASQSMLSDWHTSSEIPRFVILSPRKFGPLPFGGWCNLVAETSKPLHETEGLWWRSIAARLTKSIYLAQPHASINPLIETFYLAAFEAVEAYLDNHPADSGIPQMIHDMMTGLDWVEIGRRRRSNWRILKVLLEDKIEMIYSDLPNDVVPLGFVIRLANRDMVRCRLAEQRIFCPVHWQLPSDISPKSFPEAAKLSKTILTLPIDQRYDEHDMARIADTLIKIVQYGN